MARSKLQYLQRRNAVYYVRIPVPLSVQKKAQRKEIRHTLSTCDFAEATSLCKHIAAFFDLLFARVERMTNVTRKKN